MICKFLAEEMDKMERKIIVCTTFREFRKTENDKIQLLFLKSIKKQKYSNFLLVVTTFGEKNVKVILEEEFGNKVIVIDEELEKFRYSLSLVVLNGIKIAKEYKNSILIWCTCDIILKPNYFSIINKLYKKDIVGTTHPNLIAKTVTDYENKEFTMSSLNKGFDLLFFATELLKKEEVIDIIQNYLFYEWGVFEHFLIGIALMYSDNLVNLVNYANIIKIENDRKATRESIEFLNMCHKRNMCTALKCIRETNMPRGIKSLEYCHSKFKILKITPKWIKYVITLKINDFMKKLKYYILHV